MWVNAGIDKRHDAGTADTETILGVLNADDLRCRLCRIAVPHYGSVIVYRRGVIESVRNAWKRRSRNRQEKIPLYAYDPQQRLQQSQRRVQDRKSTRLNSSHGYISYAVFCLKKKNPTLRDRRAATPDPDSPRPDSPTSARLSR